MNTRTGVLAGAAAPLTSFVFIAAAILTHPWFSFSANALSDLGALGVRDNWIFCAGLILSGLLALLFSYYLLSISDGMGEKAGSSLFFAASVFLALIGIFPEGTAPHFAISLSFYILGAASIAVFGTVLIIEKNGIYGSISLLILISAFCMVLIPKWSAIAIPETIGASAISAWVYLMIYGITKEHILTS